MTIEQRLAKAKQIAQDAEKKRIQFETKLDAAQEKKKELLIKCEQLNVKPEELDNVIAALDKEIDDGMKELDKLLSQDEPAADIELPY